MVRGLNLRDWASVSTNPCRLPVISITATWLWQNRPAKMRTEATTNYLGSLSNPKSNKTMKLIYSQKRDRYEVWQLKELIDHDQDMNLLMTRCGWASDDELPPTEFSGDDQLSDEEIAAFFAEFGVE
jgi:hypothetical protein